MAYRWKGNLEQAWASIRSKEKPDVLEREQVLRLGNKGDLFS